MSIGRFDLLLGDDPHTKSILIYMESVVTRDRSCLPPRSRAFQTDHRHQSGRSEAASRAAASHTGALTGSDEVLEAAFRRSGVLRVHNIADLFYMAEVLSRQPRPRGQGLPF